MALVVRTEDPAQLISALYAAVRSGAVWQWTVNQDGGLTLSEPGWDRAAGFQAAVAPSALLLDAGARDGCGSKAYAVLHSKMILTLLQHFTGWFDVVVVIPERPRPTMS